jgi:hypothetical protein
VNRRCILQIGWLEFKKRTLRPNQRTQQSDVTLLDDFRVEERRNRPKDGHITPLPNLNSTKWSSTNNYDLEMGLADYSIPIREFLRNGIPVHGSEFWKWNYDYKAQQIETAG